MMPCTISGSVPKVGGHLARIEHAEPAGGAGADVEESAAAPKGGFGHFDGAGDLLALGTNGGGDGRIFGVDEIDDLERRREVDRGGARVAALGESWIEEGHKDYASGDTRTNRRVFGYSFGHSGIRIGCSVRQVTEYPNTPEYPNNKKRGPPSGPLFTPSMSQLKTLRQAGPADRRASR